MQDASEIIEAARTVLRSEPRVGDSYGDVAVSVEAGALTLDGEVPSVAAKKLVLGRCAALPGVTGIVDRLRVKPAQRMGDEEVRDLVCHALVQDSALLGFAVRQWEYDHYEPLRDPPDAGGAVEVRVEEGVVTLDGAVDSLAKKRLAGVLAWWVPGSRDVINGLAVDPPEEDNYGQISDGVRMALEKDPFVDAGQVRVAVHDAVVTLQGLVPSDAEKEMAEADAWYVFGVDEVINEIDVRP